MPDTERERDFDRFLTFIDAIVAIAITLLVLPLVELTADIGEFDTVGATCSTSTRPRSGPSCSASWSSPGCGSCSTRPSGTCCATTRGSPTCCMLWVLTIVFLPFPTALVATSASSALTKVLYIGSMVVSTAVLSLVEAFLVRHPELTDGHDDADPVGGVANVAAPARGPGHLDRRPGHQLLPVAAAAPLGPGGRRMAAAARTRPARATRVGE